MNAKDAGKRNLSRRLIINFFISTFIPFFIITFIISNAYSSKYERDIFNLFDGSLQLISKNLTVYLSNLSELTLSPYYNDYYRKATARLDDHLDELTVLERHKLENELSSKLVIERYSRVDLSGLMLVSGDEVIYYSAGMSSDTSAENGNVQQSLWYIRAQEADGRMVFVAPEYSKRFSPDSGDHMLSVARSIVNINTRKSVCTIKVNLNTSTFNNMLQNLDFFLPTKIIIINDSGDFVYSDSPLDTELIPQMLDADKVEYENSSWFCRWITVPTYNWKICLMISQAHMQRQRLWIYSVSAFIYIIAFMVALFSYNRLSKWIISSVNMIKNVLHSVRHGDFTARCGETKIQELDALSGSVNHMIQTLDQKIKTEYLMEIKQKDTEFKALQAQIQPHFLFNTLASCIALNQIGEQDKLNGALYGLTELMRYVLKSQQVVNVQQEFDFLYNYCLLQKLRFRDRLNYSIECEDTAKQSSIPKLILQPIVENAIIHGVEPLRRECIVQAKATVSGEILTLTVTDNGVGFDTDDVDIYKSIGMANTIDRLKLLDYRNEIVVESAPDKGTSVTITIYNAVSEI